MLPMQVLFGKLALTVSQTFKPMLPMQVLFGKLALTVSQNF